MNTHELRTSDLWAHYQHMSWGRHALMPVHGQDAADSLTCRTVDANGEWSVITRWDVAAGRLATLQARCTCRTYVAAKGAARHLKLIYTNEEGNDQSRTLNIYTRRRRSRSCLHGRAEFAKTRSAPEERKKN